jgi:hypothetical protein
MNHPTIILGIAKAGSTYVVFTSDECEHVATSEAQLGQLIAGLLAEPDRATVETVAPTATKIRSAAVKIAKRMLPGYEELSEPVVDGLTAFGKFLHKKMTAPRPPRPAQKRQPGPRVVRRAKAEPVPEQS